MAVYKNTSGAAFTLPDGRMVDNGASIDIDQAVLKIPGVFQFIAAGKMVLVNYEDTSAPKRGRPRKAD